ncbi:hypothetical protein C5E02_07930 [Rathayibacter rathayi]|uniref:Nucleotidyltransferase family protein n=1 Tax=Rathayibacter rathayi TaxID=33887 RepID=A0ABX5AFZ0_RATRA|nr:hypothetical protein C5C28_00710 [Rathayibacter rathayi]PPH70362.1 hypothetical protein C5C45_01495 [Rathayibacter rathayi]PPH79847.1 hypothetical protein C5C40_00710 [Rathayibacter rathayi]PPI62166.1 hypothetical protein C5E02_07930 [Rathayibacter rathayi]
MRAWSSPRTAGAVTTRTHCCAYDATGPRSRRVLSSSLGSGRGRSRPGNSSTWRRDALVSPDPTSTPETFVVAALPSAVALRLAAVLVQYTLDDYGIRSLVVKGEGLHRQGIRAPMMSADVDLWVDPDRFDDAITLLADMGWNRRAEALSWTLFVDHSITLVHPSWPCDVDVHRSFPGAFEADRVVFERLWASHKKLPLSDEVLLIPDAAHHLVLHALHQLRSARSASSATILAALEAHGAALPQKDKEAIRAAAVELGAQTPMAELLTSWGVPAPADERHRRAQALWDVRRCSDRHTFNWLHAIASAPWHLKGTLLLRAAFPTRADLEASHPGTTTTRRRLRLRWERSVRAVRGLPSALSGFIRVARSGGDVGPTPAAPAAPAEEVAEAAAPTDETPAVVEASANIADASPAPVDDSAPGPHPRERFAVERTDEQAYVLDLSRPASPPVVLSLSADTVFEAVIQQRRARDEVVAQLAERYGVDPETMGRDVDAVLAVLDDFFPDAASAGAST